MRGGFCVRGGKWCGVCLEDLRRQSCQDKQEEKEGEVVFIVVASSHKRYCGLLGLPPALVEWLHVSVPD